QKWCIASVFTKLAATIGFMFPPYEYFPKKSGDPYPYVQLRRIRPSAAFTVRNETAFICSRPNRVSNAFANPEYLMRE
ncbi:MAG TPA: hypothetical protein VKN36_16005, partial [Eudoraea sp.]|nr:hypothetical protein [Eudoraea sp.]